MFMVPNFKISYLYEIVVELLTGALTSVEFFPKVC